MASVLRLGGKDRSSFMFFKRQNAALETSTEERLDHRLPDISPIDTKSFSALFDEFMSNENNDLFLPQQTIEAPVSPFLTSANTTPTPPKAVDTKVDYLKVNINRNDSTASSCYSQPSQRDSDFSPLVTRQSSSSSYTPEPSPALSRKPTAPKPKPLTIPGRPAHTVGNHLSESPISALTPPVRSNSGLIRIVSVPPNLHKPLPPGPTDDAAQPSASVPDLLLRQPPAELPSALPAGFDLSKSGSVQQRSARRRSEGRSTAEKPVWSSHSARETRAIRHVTNGHHRNRSASDTIAPQYDLSTRDNYRRHTADMQKLVSAAPSSRRSAQSGRKQGQRPITASTAERVIYRIMCSVHSAQDLQATAMVSKGFYRTFQRNESKLVSHLMFKVSRTAWELRRSTLALKGSNEFLLKDYRRDSRTIEALKAFIVARCSANVKSVTLTGLIGQDEPRATQLDDALWRIWTFCTLFGSAVGGSTPAQTEIDWLKGSSAAGNKQLGAGFAIGNGKGLTARELEDMNEMWQCLQMLVSDFHGREQEAKRSGVFDNWHLRESTTDSQHLAEWTCYLLSLGPQTVLTLSGCSFDQAKMLGLTNWPLPPAGQSRSSFLTSALSRVYQERVLADATRRAAQMSIRRSSAPVRAPSHRPTKSLDENNLIAAPLATVDRMQTQSLRIDTSRPKRRPVTTMYTNTTTVKLDIRPDCDPQSVKMDIRPDCDPAWKATPASALLPTSPTADPTVYYSMTATSTASAKLGATLFPMDYANPAPRVPFPAQERTPASISEVIDPVDKAMNLLVRDLGYPETRARKALAMCDTGSGIDLQKAIELLSVDAKEKERFSMPVELPTPGGPASPARSRRLQPPKAFCDGHCKSNPNLAHSRNLSTGTTISATDMSVSPVSISQEAEWADTITPLASNTASSSRQSALNRVSSRAKAWKAIARGDGAPKRKQSVLRIDEYQAKVERRKSMRAASIGEQSPKVVKEGLGKNLLGLGLGIGSNAGAKSVEDQLERAREEERRRKEKGKAKAGCMPRYA